MDINGDLISDLIYTSPVPINEDEYEIMVARGLDKAGTKFDINDKFNNYLIKDKDELGNVCYSPVAEDFISSPNSNSFIDLNGDCMADIFM